MSKPQAGEVGAPLHRDGGAVRHLGARVMANSAWPLELQPLDLIGQRDDARRQGMNGEGERVQLPSFGVADHYRLNSLVGLGRICGNYS